MLKIINDAVISKCGECKIRTCDLFGRLCCPFQQDEKKQDYKPVNPDTIDKNCPLQDVEVITEYFGYGLDNNEVEIKRNLEIYLNHDINIDDIDHIIIVKKQKEL